MHGLPPGGIAAERTVSSRIDPRRECRVNPHRFFPIFFDCERQVETLVSTDEATNQYETGESQETSFLDELGSIASNLG